MYIRSVRLRRVLNPDRGKEPYKAISHRLSVTARFAMDAVAWREIACSDRQEFALRQAFARRLGLRWCRGCWHTAIAVGASRGLQRDRLQRRRQRFQNWPDSAA